MRLAEWVDMVKATGGVPEGGPEPFAALRSASTLCGEVMVRQGIGQNPIVRLGVEWMAAFMVSCARHDVSDFRSILVPSDQQQAVLSREVARNRDRIGDILLQAASAERRLFLAAFPPILFFNTPPPTQDNTIDP